MTPNHFIIIDDDKVSNLLCRISIKSYFPESTIVTFNCPEQALAFITSEYSTIAHSEPVILFLDINMPVWSGWDFLENFEKLNNLKTAFSIYIMSSSIDENDMALAATNQNVIGYIKKPFTKVCIAQWLKGNIK